MQKVRINAMWLASFVFVILVPFFWNIYITELATCLLTSVQVEEMKLMLFSTKDLYKCSCIPVTQWSYMLFIFPSVQGGKEVVLISLERPRTPVGKAILEHSSPSTIVGGIALGTQCCKVFLREVLQRDAPLFHKYGGMKKMSDALYCSIPWPSVLVISSIHHFNYSRLFLLPQN